MYLIKALLKNNKQLTYACSDTESMFQLIWTFDNESEHIKAWKIDGYVTEHFGWAPLNEWNKGRLHFTEEDFKA
jgi:hypothetical protein